MSANDSVRPWGLGRLVLPAALLCALLVVGVAKAEVTLYEKAPSVEELQQKLLGGEQAGGEQTGQKKFRTRAIVFVDAPPAPGAEASAVQPPKQPPAGTAALPVASAPVASVSPAPQTLQVSDNAIAFLIRFRVNSAQVLPESIPFLQSIAGLMHKNPGIRLLVEGHTDISGSYQRNVVLSRERAFAVTNFLIDRFGIDPMRLMPVGKGPMEPLPGREPTDSKNRRVQFRIIG